MSGRRPVRTSLRATTVVLAVAASALSLTAVGTASPATAQPAGGTSHPLPYEDSRLPVPRRVADLLSRMTLEEKVGQMTQTERYQVADDTSPITTWHLGSILSGGGSTPTPNTPTAWADMVDRFQRAALATRLHIPLLYGIDSVHGDGNMLGATVFPHNIGLGATRDPALVREVEHVTASETRSSGPQWAFAPCLCAARDDRWGRTYESFGEDPRLVEQMETAIDGLQGPPGHLGDRDRVLATVKHYAGDGDTRYGTGSGDYPIDQGVAVTDRKSFWRNALQQYVPAVRQHHAGSVMPSYSSVDWTEDGVGNPVKMHGNRELLTGVLKGAMGFHGVVISDWEGIHQLPGDWPTQVRTGVNAGIDMMMEPNAYQSFETTLLDEVHAGRVPTSRIDDAVSRILTAKFELGLFEHPFTDRTDLPDIGGPAHRAVARRAVAESQVLLANHHRTLPVRPGAHLYVAGSNADDIGNQAGGWTMTWQGGSGATIPGTTILDGLRQGAGAGNVTWSQDASAPVGPDDVGVVVVGETPYAEGFGDVGGPRWAYDPGDHGVPRPVKDMQLSGADKAAVDRVCSAAASCVVVVVSGRPLVLDPQQLGEADAVVAAWLPGSEGEGVADTLLGRRPFTGKLPVSWPRTVAQEPVKGGDPHDDPLFPFGFGLTTARRTS
ncbi:glycoside hydrolase family 3 protein [Oryzihumus leptocrescens]|uniref:glycoside hydrolase family 3 protein n=1 Tax=Oryzihumus leptocrescens TaxID=297536 RepID=UPI001152B65D|nr:glycoside hydrolase family 3 protein [Oryzihumus leptocrescens]